ncbi:hypothetical protein IFT66_01775 [Rhizobium sp. CFBP 13726]|uniref:hypothetical protein n=1 Tax=Rhizobium sp. CFBP 13726 TaxID=2775296 RepID=UPI00177B2E17|nr:hypothetical protein [Rhizobium sp. CFBP 13726]MBD8649805.1 hypothetical protein [Rhizobium sp. CFBP 13726]
MNRSDALAGFDPDLFGLWTDEPLYDADDDVTQDAELGETVRNVLLELKSAETELKPADELRQLLNEMTAEMRQQFATFRTMREAASGLLSGEADDAVSADGNEAAQKLARADVKAATDAMSLIVRTLEKVDALQRQLSRDRQVEADRLADAGGYEEAKARFVRMIEDRANETAFGYFEAWKRDGPPGWVAQRLPTRGTQPAQDAAGRREDHG